MNPIVYTDIVQGSADWFELRLGLPTASEFGSVLAKGQGKVRKAYMCRLAAERILGETQGNYTNRHMQRGKDWERDALDRYAFLNEVEPQIVGFVTNGIAGCSPDALLGLDGMVEIKTKLPPLMVEVLSQGGVPVEHKPQVQGGLWVTGRQWCDFVCYWPEMPLFVARAERDEDYITMLADEVAQFADQLDDLVRQIGMTPRETMQDMLERSLADG